MSDHHAVITDLAARVRQLESDNQRLLADNQRLSASLDRLADRLDRLVPDTEPATKLDRRALLKRAGAVAVGATAATVAGAAVTAPSAAAAAQPLYLGGYNEAGPVTVLAVENPDTLALAVTNHAGGPQRRSRSIDAVGADVGIYAACAAGGRAGVVGASPSTGAQLTAVDRCGVGGVGADGSVGVLGTSDTIGVAGRSQAGRGGVFSGGKSPLRLLPSTMADPPLAAETGDFFVDAGGQLWFCKRGGSEATWSRLTIN